MDYILLLIVTATASFKALICKKLGNDGGGVGRLLLLNSAIFLIATVPVFCFALAGGGFSLSGYSLALAACYAAVMIFTQLCQIAAMRYGTTSMTTLIYSAGFLIPIVFSRFAFGEEISVWQGVGVLILLGAVYMIVNPRANGRLSVRWLVFALLAMSGSGVTAIIQKIHQRSEFSGELPSFLTAAFLFAAAFCFLLRFLFPSERCGGKAELRAALFPAVSGLCIGFLNLLNLTLAGKLPSVVHFPVYNVGSMILTGVLGSVLFKERITPVQAVGFAVGCAAILIVGLF